MEGLDNVPSFAKEQVINYVEAEKSAFTTLRNPSEWSQGLMQILATHNNCEVYLANCAGRDDEGNVINFKGFSIVGRMTDILIVEELFYWLLMQIIQISFKFGKGKDDQWLSDFRIGAVLQLEEKFNALKPEAPEGITEAQVKTALVRIDEKKKDVDAMMEELNKRLDDGQAVKKADDEMASRAGYEAAKAIMLDAPVALESAENTKKLTTGE
jgi:hypothetical protein